MGSGEAGRIRNAGGGGDSVNGETGSVMGKNLLTRSLQRKGEAEGSADKSG